MTGSLVRKASLLLLVGATEVVAQPAGFSVHWPGGQRTISAADINTLPRRSAPVTMGTGDTSTVSDVSLWDVIMKAGAVPENASGRQRGVAYVKLTGADGQNAVVALVEIDPSFSPRPVLLVDTRGGRPLDSSEGPWRVIIPTDLRHSRWIRGLSRVSIEIVK
jgi:hypothetical protein